MVKFLISLSEVIKMNLELFANDRYKVLKILSENQITIKEESYVPLSQQEIADLVHFSKLKTNKIMNELKDYGCVVPFQGKKGKYALTEIGLKVVYAIKNIGIGNTNTI